MLCRFIKVKTSMLQDKWPPAEAAVIYGRWANEIAERQTAAQQLDVVDA